MFLRSVKRGPLLRSLKMHLWLSVFLIAFIFPIDSAASGPKNLPKGIRKCALYKPDATDCLAKSSTEAFKAFKGGAPELGIPEMDPLFIPELIIDQGNTNNPVSLNMKLNNMIIHGMSEQIFENFSMNIEEMSVEAYSMVAKMVIEGDYESSGKVLLFNLKGHGYCNFTMDNTRTRSRIKFSAYEKGGETYWKVDSYELNIMPEKVTMYMGNLLNTQRGELNEGLNKFLNDNWGIVYDSLRPSFDEAYSTIFKDGATRVFSRVPVNRIFDLTE